MKSRFLLVYLGLVVIFIVSFSSKVLALSPTDIDVDMVPENPAPNENVDIDLSSFYINLDTVSMSWFVGGKNVLSGIGKKSLSVTAPALGSETIVSVKITTPEGPIEKKISIRPNEAVLLWQATDSYVPPFYKGKAMPALSSEIKVVAMPEIRAGGVMLDYKKMTYNWRRDYSNEVEASGYGKNFFTYLSDYLDKSSTIEVAAGTIDGKYSSTANINVGAMTPEISLYKKDPALGVLWENTIESGHLITGDEIIIAAPYFISPKDIRSPELVFSWFINGTLTGIQDLRKNSIPLRVQEGVSGTSRLRLEIENQNKIFQTANKEIELQF